MDLPFWPDCAAAELREVVARIPDARLEIIPRNAHHIPIDEPEELAKRIEEFVTPLPRDASPDSSSLEQPKANSLEHEQKESRIEEQGIRSVAA